ncbi:hypothetical protein PR001_g18275 [Phytophthora rubi]|nr:hypothetical protein PR002_g18745 [Phytophthora rubi]KAE9002363.1 hypothetical protein PR001_g18275 [Phytophthora rubi]
MDKAAARLLRMGVVTERPVETGQYGWKTILAIVSPMMKRVCLDALPTREIHQTVTAEDPVQLLAVALTYVNPNTIAHFFVQNRCSQSEAVFHFELYAVIRDMLRKANQKKIYRKAKITNANTRADILVVNGSRLAYELKVNQLLEQSEINVAASQAYEYKQQFRVQRMLIVNFVPAGHVFDKVYRVEACPGVEIVHVQFRESCDDFTISYLPEENIPQGEQNNYVGKLQSQCLKKIKHIEVSCQNKSLRKHSGMVGSEFGDET